MILKSQCLQCRYYEKMGKCFAFTKKIPKEIISGKFDHTKKYPGQKNDIVFEPIKE